MKSEKSDVFLEEIKKLSWVYMMERPYGPFMVSMTFKGVDSKYYERVGLKGFGFGYCANLYQYPLVYRSEKLTETNRKALNEYFKEHSIFDLSRIFSEMHRKNIDDVKKLLLSNAGINEKLSAIGEMLCLYVAFIWLIDPLEPYFQDKIERLVPKYVKDAYKWVGEVSVPVKKNFYARMQEALLTKPIEEVQKEYGWLRSRDGFTRPYTLEELEEIKKKTEVPKTHKVEIPEELKDFSEELKELTFFRTHRTDCFYELLWLARPILEEIAGKFKLTFEELAFYDAGSILKGKPKKISVPFNYLYYKRKQWIQYERFMQFEEDKKSEIKGRPTFPGIVTGTVKIIKHPSQLDKVREGDIFVTQMTFPSFIGAMHRAAAFITDEGGITCHAAIIARELKKPCIVGTGNATRLLKDGDLVEVDAGKGVVRIIKRS